MFSANFNVTPMYKHSPDLYDIKILYPYSGILSVASLPYGHIR